MNADLLFNAAGWSGAVVYLATYAALQLGLVRGNGYLYPLLNAAAASLVLVGLSSAFNASAAAIQVVWIVVSLIGITRILLLRHMIEFSREEKSLRAEVLPNMDRASARRLLSRGFWVDGEPETELTTEGVPVDNLYYLADGRARVLSGERRIASLSRGFIGEMNVMDRGAASATVILQKKSRMFVISGDNLRRMARSDAELRLALEQALSRSTRKKLIEANAVIGAERR